MGREHEHNSYYFISCLGNKKISKKLQIHKMCISLNKYFILFNSRSVCYGIKFKFSQKNIYFFEKAKNNKNPIQCNRKRV